MKVIALVFIFFVCLGCSTEDSKVTSYQHQTGEYIYRKHDEIRFQPEPAQLCSLPPYPWEKGYVGNQLRITKEFFRCKGNSLNPMRTVQEKGELLRFFDCGGSAKHSLPLRDNKEFIYPILIDILNYIQEKTEKKVVITSGHRCPTHNAYCDPAPSNQYSKHMIGAEVSFYVQGMEERPETIVAHIQKYFKESSKYGGKKEFLEFKRYEKEDTNVSTKPWYNKEIFVKLFKKKEGRNFDNRHPYPYLSIQVRYDYDTKEKVIYTWDRAQHNYLRY